MKPHIMLSSSATIGYGTNICHGAIIEKNTTIGKHSLIGYHNVIRPNVKIGDKSQIRAHCFVAESANIGSKVHVMQFSNICRDTIIEDCVFIGMGTILTNTKKIAYLRNYECKGEPPYIEYGVRIGARCLIMPGVRIGKESLIAAGSTVTSDVKPGYIYKGSPARCICKVPEEEMINGNNK